MRLLETQQRASFAVLSLHFLLGQQHEPLKTRLTSCLLSLALFVPGIGSIGGVRRYEENGSPRIL